MLKVAITGKMRSGKDTLAGWFIEKGVAPFTFKMGIEEIVDKYFPTAKHHGKPRRHYQHIGQQLRVLDSNVWINYTLLTIDKYLDKYPAKARKYGVMITDLRQPNEYEALKKEGYIIIKVECADEERLRRMEQAGDVFSAEDLKHETERNVDLITPDYFIDNNGSKKDLYIQFCDLWDRLTYDGSLM